ncbi:N-6 DNA methylase [Vibrio fluvialis]|nr:N-6 DNA methylase [Vibrio fluvialis]
MMLNLSLQRNSREIHEQFYTSKELGELLVSYLPTSIWSKPSLKTLDLCMGQGSLLECVSEKKKSSLLYGSDIDPDNITAVHKNKNISVKTKCIDASNPSVTKLFEKNTFDLVVGNPPFKLIKNTSFIREQFSEVGLSFNSKLVEAEAYFLMYGLKLLKNNGHLAYILPDGFFTNNSLSSLRKHLSDNLKIEAIVEIPPRSFVGTEAKTHLIVIKKTKSNNNKINLHSNNSPTIKITKREFINRGDYSFYKKATALKMKTLESLGISLIRGRKSKKEIIESGKENYIHTTNLEKKGSTFSNFSTATDTVKAVAGDIVLARVGTRCLGKYGVVKNGEYYISDCIIIIRCKYKEHLKLLLKTISSPFGQSWINSVSKGVGARHITVSDLYQLPILIEKNHEN